MRPENIRTSPFVFEQALPSWTESTPRVDTSSVELLRKEARYLDATDPLRHVREEFHVPSNCAYLCGNSLGLQPRGTAQALQTQLSKWAQRGVDGHFTSPTPWATIEDEACTLSMPVVGAKYAHEVAVMNSLTVNIHLLLTSFYRPTETCQKVIVEAHSFPSDEYALQTHLQARGIDPNMAIVKLKPRKGEILLRHEDIEETIAHHASCGDLALVFLPGVQYYTGQVFPMKSIAKQCQHVGVPLGLDLAHAVGNIPLQLHDWGVDFAVWCSYKYLNAGPGSLAGAFLHDRHANADLPRLAGWWGHKRGTRFNMPETFDPQMGARGLQLSNPPVFAIVPVTEALKVLQQVGGVSALREKSVALTDFLERGLLETMGAHVDVISPGCSTWRGCQLSVRLTECPVSAAEVNRRLHALQVVCDVREPDVIRVAPTPMYNSFTDVVAFVTSLQRVLAGLS